MGGKSKFVMFMLNIGLGGLYIAAILCLIGWVADGHMGFEGFLIPVGLCILLMFGWILSDLMIKPRFLYKPSPLTQNELS